MSDFITVNLPTEQVEALLLMEIPDDLRNRLLGAKSDAQCQISEKYRRYAIENLNNGGTLEVDDGARVSSGDLSDGAYVECWAWIDAEDVLTDEEIE